MAGRRKGTGRPLKRVTRIGKRQEALVSRLHATRTWRERLGPAMDYVRAGIERVALDDPRAADAAAEQLVGVLLRLGADLDSHVPRRRSA